MVTSRVLYRTHVIRLINKLIRSCEPGSSVSIVSDYGLNDLVIEVRFPAEAKGFYF
jgi:hypothetical protein